MKKILCVCIGNSDRSPVMAAVLGSYLKQYEVSCESAGIAAQDGPAAQFAIKAAKRIGLDISGHAKRRTTDLDLTQYDLFVCANDEIAKEIVNSGIDVTKVWNAQIVNPWPVHFEQEYEQTIMSILGAMYKVVARYF